MVAFNEVPSNLRVPFVTAEFDASQASQGPSLLAYKVLIIAQKLAAGSAAANSLKKVTRADDLIALAGRGSIAHRQAISWYASNKSTELWFGFLDDDGAGVAASGTITVTGPATAAGTIALYLGGVRITVGVTDTLSANDTATAIAAAINLNLDIPVTATATLAVVTVTFRHKGEVGNSYDMRDGYRDSDALPAGIGLTYVALASGTANPSLANLIAAMGDTWYNIISHPYTDSTNLAAIEVELADRNGPMRMIDGLAVTSSAGTLSALTTLGNGRNSKHSVIKSQPGKNPLTPPMEFAAESAAILAFYGAADPARPFQTLSLKNAVAPEEADLFTLQERNLLLFDGIATTRVGAGGVVQIERPITTYQTNASGAADTAYLDSTTLLTLMYLRYSWRNRMQTKYPRHKLAADATKVGDGQFIMTPQLGRAEALGWFRQMIKLGLVEDYDKFKADLVVARNDANPNRLDHLLSPDIMNQLIVSATRLAFRL